jgi:hypothetical protein
LRPEQYESSGKDYSDVFRMMRKDGLTLKDVGR